MARFPELFEGECDGWENDPIVGILRSAAKQAPVLAELAAPIIHEDAPLIDANIDVGWCRDQLTDETSSAKGRTEVKDRLAKALDRIAKMEAKTPRGQEIKARHGAAMEQERQQKSELRQRADALVAEFDCPLPGGDAGLIEAERRITEITRRTRALYAEFEIDLKSEAEIINGIIDPVRDLFWSYIDETPPASLAGAAVKLRLLRAADEGLSEGEVGSGAITSIRQLAGFVEREASR